MTNSYRKIKVLLLNVNRDGWHSGNLIYDMQVISAACDTIIYGPGHNRYTTTSLPKILMEMYGNNDAPDVIYSYFYPNESVRHVYVEKNNLDSKLCVFPTDFHCVKNIPKIYAVSDFWHKKSEENVNGLLKGKFSHCFSCFAPPYSNLRDFFSFFPGLNDKIKFVGMPRCIDENCFRDYGENKIYDVITVGSMNSFYPLRVKMHAFMSKFARDLGINYRNYPHCGYNFSHSDFVREKYARAINGAKILLSCGGRYHLAFNKIFEAMGCKTAYFGEKPYGEKELHMEDGVNYVAVDSENYIDKIQHYLRNGDLLEKITNNGYELFKRYHSISSRAADFDIAIRKALGK